ncbi:NAD(P)/FAD-dependent oxidoreductase [Kangiella shandongensis]|uniref:NAD(P)/FAD-dependent oxidoreductase n=1 Tax=Kangiella shandongensis TaxID=2763258 RepID=UPI001CBC6C40|nr:FAD/NAD(P)-binding oxidoreductase [Kangiella shandongensis]
MAHIVVVGGGIGGIPAAYEMKDLVGSNHQVTLISESECFQFTPSNPWVAVNWRKKEEIQVELPPIMAKRNINFSAVGVKRVEPKDNKLVLNDGSELTYDYLIIATGPKLAFDEIEGMGPNHFTYSVCTTSHAGGCGRDWQKFVMNPGPIVVGAVQGASCFGPAYEYALILDTDLRKRGIRDQVPITFITSEPYIGHLGLDGVGDTKSLLESKLRDRNIKWVVNASINSVQEGALYYQVTNEQDQTSEEKKLEFKHSMLLPAFKGVDAVAGIDDLVNARGFVLTNDFQQNPTFGNIFSVGVCVAIPPVGETPVPVGVPKTGYMIESMVTAATNNIKQLINGEEPSHKPSLNAICLADFGDGGVAFVAKPQIGPRNLNWAGEGKWVHWAKVAFEKYFLRKIRKGKSTTVWETIMLDWMNIKRLKKKP